MDRYRISAMVGLAVIVAACSSEATVATTVVDAADLVVTTREWRFDPGAATVPSNVGLSIEVRNAGDVSHEWALVDGVVETETDLRDAVIVASVAVESGGVVRLELPPLVAGDYQVVCPIPGHISNGMIADLSAAP